MKVEIENTDENDLIRIRQLVDLIPKICDILRCPLPERVMFKWDWYMGCYIHKSKTVAINLEAVQETERTKEWPYWIRTARRLKPYKPDLAVHTLAHELAHWKQVCEGKLTADKMYSTSYWKGKENPRYFSANKKTYPKSYHDGACERDANSWASYVIKELHREKYLYK